MARKKAAPAEAESEGKSKMDAVRSAIEAGVESPEEGVSYIKAQYDLDITKPMFSNYKAVIKRKEKPSKEPIDPFEGLAAVKQLVRLYGADRVKQMAELFEE